MDNQLTQELTLIVEENNLPVNKTEELLKSFGGYFQEAKQIATEANSIKVTDESQVELMSQAHEARVKLKSIRIEAEKTKITLKEQSLREGNAIQGVFNIIKALVIPIEEYLEKQEKFVEIKKAEREEIVFQERIVKLQPYIEDLTIYNVKDMSEYAFNQLLENSKFAFEVRKEAEKKAEEEKIAKEKADRIENEHIRVENEKLRLEAEAKEQQLIEERKKQEEVLKKQHEEQEVKLAQEREAREKLEAELKAKAEAEEQAKKVEEENKRQALLAPDKDKLKEFAVNIEKVFIPAVSSNEAQQAVNEASKMLLDTINFLKEKAKAL